jgi:peroxiredoxin
MIANTKSAFQHFNAGFVLKITSLGLLLMLSLGILNAQFTLKVETDILPQNRISIYTIHGDKFLFLDSLKMTDNKVFEYTMPAEFESGMYRLSFGPKAFADLILNQESVHIKTSVTAPMDSMRIIQSRENHVYYEFLHLKKDHRLKMDLINPIVLYYPDADDFYQLSLVQFSTIQQSYKTSLDSLIKLIPGSFTAKYLSIHYAPILKQGLSRDEQVDYLQVHFFDGHLFNDPVLLLSDAYPLKLVEYLSLFTEADLSREEMTREFKRAIDLLMSRPMPEVLIRDYIYQYLLEGFQQYGFDEVIAHMASNYQQGEPCENEARKSDLKSRLESFQKLAIGQPAPNFSLPDLAGNLIELKKISGEYRLLFFYTSDCPHCREMYPKLMEWYELQEEKRVEVLAVSLDHDLDDWKEFIQGNAAGWKDLCDGLAWESEVVNLYNIYATPTIFVLDRDGKIIAKPILLREIESWFGK